MNDERIINIIINKLEEQFRSLMEGEPEFYKGYKIILTNEQQFIKEKERKPKNIFIVVKFLQGNRDFNQQRQPFSLNAIGEQNSIEVCQKLMMDFGEKYNLNYEYENEGYVLRQTLSTVSSLSNFNEIFNGYRSLFYITGTFFIGINSNPIVKIVINDEKNSFGENGEEILFLSAQYSYNTQTDSQPFFNTNNFSRTINKIATFSLGFSVYAVESLFYKSCMDLIFNKGNNVDIDKKYKISVWLKSSETPYVVDMRLASVSGVQELRDFPATSFTFVR